MIKKLRWRFIRITMASVFLVLLLIVIAVNTVNICQNNQSLDSVTQILLENNGAFRREGMPFDKNKPGFLEEEKEKPDRMHNQAELPFSTRFFTITFDEEGQMVGSDLSSIASVTEEDVDVFAEKLFKGRDAVGWYKNYRYRVGSSTDGYLLILMEATGVRSGIFSVLAITLIVGTAAFLIVFVLVALFSKRAIRPISETYEKQRQFITDASHELKTPLTVIAANAEIMELTYGENEWCVGIKRQSERMRTLIGKMIQMSKLDEGEQPLVFERFNLSDAVYDTAMSFEIVAAAKGLKLICDVAPDCFFEGDEAAIRQVVSILVDNAVKYCDENGTIAVTLSRTARGFGREKRCICVRNTCAAAAAVETERVFDRFYRGDKAHTANNSYGLGLPIAKSITELYKGKIEAFQTDGTEIVFMVTLP